MKRFLIWGILLVLLMMPLVAEASDSVVVKTITGRVKLQDGLSWVSIEEGMELNLDAVVNVGLNSTLVLESGDETFTVKAMQKGALMDLLGQDNSGSTGISLGADLSGSSITSAEDQDRSNISTASTRASDATEDLDWME